MSSKSLKDRIKSKQPKKKTKEDATMSVLDLLHGSAPIEKEEEEDEDLVQNSNPNTHKTKKKKRKLPIY